MLFIDLTKYVAPMHTTSFPSFFLPNAVQFIGGNLIVGDIGMDRNLVVGDTQMDRNLVVGDIQLEWNFIFWDIQIK